jgi:hypothetical protein
MMDLAKLTSLVMYKIPMKSFPAFVLRMKWSKRHSSQFGAQGNADGA